MTFLDSFTQFNMNSFDGLNNSFTPQLPFLQSSWDNLPIFNFSDFNFNFSDIPSWFNTPNWFQSPAQWNNSPSATIWDNNRSNLKWDSTPQYNNSWNNSLCWGDTFQWSTSACSANSISNRGAINLDGYNSSKGKKLAADALNHSVGFSHHCARYVNNALERTGLSNGQSGHAFQMIDILRKNKNFKEISVASVDYKHLPAGCILVFGKGVQGYHKDYGHVEIATGDGRAVSDGITHNIKKPSAIFMPV